MDLISTASVLLTMFGALAVAFFSCRSIGRPAISPGRATAVFGGLSCLVTTGLFCAYKIFHAIPVWPFHISLAVFWSVLGFAWYLKFKETTADEL
ncbi:MAG: hypothetical protein JO002_06660 [Burkholderiaceae bacterium]|nr:hypothetical protein [Burkholderiaceae bacterium]